MVFGDFLKLNLNDVTDQKPYCVVANLPYYITTDAVLKLITADRKPDRITIMVQKEAAARLMSEPGSKLWCAAAAAVQYYGIPQVRMILPPSVFTPPPHVESVLLTIERHQRKPVTACDDALLQRVIGAAFLMRRKTLANNLTSVFSVDRDRALEWIDALGADQKIRGESLSVAQLCALTDIIHSSMHGKPFQTSSPE